MERRAIVAAADVRDRDAMKRAFLSLSLLLAAGCSTSQPPSMPEFIGQAMLAADGTLTLDLESVECDGSRAMGRVVYAPGHPQHAEILAHIGEIRPGETKPVRPWPSEPCPTGKNR